MGAPEDTRSKSSPRLPTVLIVDDNPDMLVQVGSYLAARGIRVVPSNAALGVSSLVIRHRPEIVVLDVMMPALDGGSLAKLLLGLKSVPDMRIVFYSSMDEERLYELARTTPRASYVLKSDGLAALYEAISTALGDSRG
ncbi:response regulator [Pendulispora rubella]|uniref:Response regulator n=1 Tax=Pendulispora rubella TaxID=2741070 RepID=A0ABZ2KR70_9BACT